MRNEERGSAAVEALLIAPVLLVLLALLIGGGRLLSDRAAIRAVAREAGRVAVTASNASEAASWGRARALETAIGYGLDQSRLQVSVVPGAFRRGGSVVVEVGYAVELADLPAMGIIPGNAGLTTRHVEPIDRYSSR